MTIKDLRKVMDVCDENAEIAISLIATDLYGDHPCEVEKGVQFFKIKENCLIIGSEEHD